MSLPNHRAVYVVKCSGFSEMRVQRYKYFGKYQSFCEKSSNFAPEFILNRYAGY